MGLFQNIRVYTTNTNASVFSWTCFGNWRIFHPAFVMEDYYLERVRLNGTFAREGQFGDFRRILRISDIV